LFEERSKSWKMRRAWTYIQCSPTCSIPQDQVRCDHPKGPGASSSQQRHPRCRSGLLGERWSPEEPRPSSWPAWPDRLGSRCRASGSGIGAAVRDRAPIQRLCTVSSPLHPFSAIPRSKARGGRAEQTALRSTDADGLHPGGISSLLLEQRPRACPRPRAEGERRSDLRAPPHTVVLREEVGLKAKERRRAQFLVRQHRDLILRAWHEHFE